MHYARYLISIDSADAMTIFFLNECLSLNCTLAYLEWHLVFQTLCGERPKTEVTPEVKKKFLSNTNFFFLYSTNNGHSEKLSACHIFYDILEKWFPFVRERAHS